MLSPEPILDIVRGLSTVPAAFAPSLINTRLAADFALSQAAMASKLGLEALQLLQIASGTIAFNQVKTLYEELFFTECNNCRGTGRMTCPMCHGRNKCRSRPLTQEAAAKLRMPNHIEPADSQ